MRVSRRDVAVVLVALALGSMARVSGAQDAATPALTPDEMASFLLHADIVAHASLPRGKTRPAKLTLSDGVRTHDAVFQSIDETIQRKQFADGRIEMYFRDSYHYNVAAYRLAVLLGIGDMVPVTVERTWNGRRGSLSWWIDWKWDEMMRRKEDAHAPPDRAVAYSNQVHLSRLFGELIHDTDRNQTNTLITADWRLYMVDFTRAFRTSHVLQQPQNIMRCSRALLASLQALTRDSVTRTVAGHLEPAEITGLLARRDKVVERVEQLVKERGEASVLF